MKYAPTRTATAARVPFRKPEEASVARGAAASAVLFVNRYYAPDIAATSQMTAGIATRLVGEAAAVHVVTSRQRHDDPDARLPARQEMAGVRVHRLGTTRFGRGKLAGRALDYISFHLLAALAVLRLARRGDLVVAATDPPLLSISVGAAAALKGARRVNWLHDIFPETASALGVVRRKGAVDRTLRALRDLSLRGRCVNVVLGERMARRVEALGARPDGIRVIHNFADAEAITVHAREDNPLRAEWGLGDAFVVGYSGNLGRAHEFETILDAAERMRDRPDIVFLFIGGGYHRERVAAEAAVRGLPNIVFQDLQPAERLSWTLGVADVHLVSLLPELEGLIVPSKVYGIAAAGRPTLFIGDTDGEVARVVRANDCGAAVARGDGKGLADLIAGLEADAALRRRWSGNARRAFERSFSADRAAAAWRDILWHEEAVAQPGLEPRPPSSVG